MHGLGGGLTFDYLSTPSFARLNYTPEAWYHARLNFFDNGNFFGMSFDAIPGLGGSYSSKYGGVFSIKLTHYIKFEFRRRFVQIQLSKSRIFCRGWV
jgi:hypothetical protein